VNRTNLRVYQENVDANDASSCIESASTSRTANSIY
jgi:hypothetical protein